MRARMFGPLPANGVWTTVGLTRAQLLAIVALVTAAFVLVGGPLWLHLREAHVARIAVSYAAIPVLVAGALARNRTLGWRSLVGASLLIAVVKLLLTAGLVVVLALARG